LAAANCASSVSKRSAVIGLRWVGAFLATFFTLPVVDFLAMVTPPYECIGLPDAILRHV
jgi:hypothetical protein